MSLIWNTTKTFLLVTFISWFLISKVIAAPSLAWNTFLGGTGQHLGYGIAIDSNENVYAVGLTNTSWNTTLFGNPLSNIGFQGGASDGVVAKLSSSGTVQWYRFFGGSSNDAISAVDVDSSGNVYVLGYALSALSGLTGVSPVHTAIGDVETFVVKMDTDGNIVWLTYLGSTSADYAYALDVDNSGNVYIGGESYRTWHSDFNNVKGTNKSSDGYEGYMVKLNSSGVYQWHRFTGIYAVMGVALDDAGGNLYTVRSKWGSNYDTEVGKYNTSTGAQVWISSALGSSGADQGWGIDVDSSGNAYILGTSNATWGTNPVRSHAGSTDAFIAKLNASGTLQWHTFLGSTAAENCRSQNNCAIKLDSYGNIYASFYGAATWGSPVIAYTGGTNDGEVVMLNNDGALQWNLFLGGTGNTDALIALDATASGNLYVSGFSNTSWGSPLKISSSFMYAQTVAKIANDLNNSPVASAGSDEAYRLDGTTIDLEGTCTDADTANTLQGWWSQNSGATCTLSGNITTAKASGNSSISASASCLIDVTANSNLVFQLSCNDGTVTTTDSKAISVNAAPTAVSQSTSTDEDVAKAITLSASDPDNESLSYTIVSSPSHGSLSGTGSSRTYTPATNYFGSDSFTFKVSDGLQYSDIATILISITSVNDAPVISGTVEDMSCRGGTSCMLPTLTPADADNDSLSYSWRQVSGPATLRFTDNGVNTTEFRPPRGTYVVEYVTTDNLEEIVSDPVTIIIPNNPPYITGEISSVGCTHEISCLLPELSADDYDGDTITTEWRQVSGPGILYLTEAGQIDLENYRAKRGTYIMEYVTADDFEEVSSDPVTVTVPNNPPEIAPEEDVAIEGADIVDEEFVLTAFERNIDIDAVFSDFDEDTLAYSWSLNIQDPDQAGFLSTTSGSSNLRVRMAGNIVITVSADDGHGGETFEEITLSIPVPELTDEESAISISQWKPGANGKARVTGSLRSPVWPVIQLNGATANVALDSASLSMSKSLDAGQMDTYTFTAEDIDASADLSTVDIEVLTNVNGENAMLFSKTASLSNVEDNSDGRDSGDSTEVKVEEEGSEGASLNASFGCSLVLPRR